MHGNAQHYQASHAKKAKENRHVKTLDSPSSNPVSQLEQIESQSPLHIAVLSSSINVVKFLVKTDINLNLTDKDGNTALHLAVKQSRSTPEPRGSSLLGTKSVAKIDLLVDDYEEAAAPLVVYGGPPLGPSFFSADDTAPLELLRVSGNLSILQAARWTDEDRKLIATKGLRRKRD
ncbi:ion channel nompc [Culex quinquefasciatus]|uniref:Ion channel nompc n=1 Tax=Culex quinquefasciatus TaxID=7176 RepID=B0WH28_CULQU|nr:ion channel nompc [Culex quinquefasciatus]|eukprot:XP_001848012.1 ion channel nompc [Culex quinquefasciatus]